MKIVIIGGGIAGLTCAFTLKQHGMESIVIEQQASPGGNVQTFEQEGFRMERGPHTFLASVDDVFVLTGKAGLSEQLTVSNQASHRRFIVRDKQLHEAPLSLSSFIGSNLLSMRAKLRLMMEPFYRGYPHIDDTAETFFTRRFGKEAAQILAGAFITGVYAGDPSRLSAAAAFPLFWRFEQEKGSMIRGALAFQKTKRKERKLRGLPLKRRGLWSFKNGLGELSRGIAKILGDTCQMNISVTAIRRDAKTYLVETNMHNFKADCVVIATPSHEAAGITSQLDKDLAAIIADIEYAPIATVYMGFNKRLDHIPDGYGFLAPRAQGIRSLGVLFPSRIFHGRAPNGGDLLTGFVGGTQDPDALTLSDQELLDIIQSDLEQLTGSNTDPEYIRIVRHPRAIPQLTVGHLSVMENIRSRLTQSPGLFLAGNYLTGVGMKDAVASGLRAANDIIAVYKNG